MPNEVYLTKESLEKTKKQLDELKNIKRREIAERIQEAKELGDLSENAEYAAAKNEQGFNEGKIFELENILRNTVLIKTTDKSDTINIGSTIKVEMNNNQRDFTVVGDSEIDPLCGKISYHSPLGQAFMGKKVGECGQAKTPKGTTKFKIIEIS